jgi:hypothetical protein
MSNQLEHRETTDEAQTVSKTYVTMPDLPDNPTVKVVFHGLFCFCFDGKKECESGIHNKTHEGGAHKHPHDLLVNVWVKNGECPSAPIASLRIGDPKRFGDINLKVSGTSLLDGTYVYQNAQLPDPFDRTNSSPDPLVTSDWRWVLDFEGPDFYDRHLDAKHPQTLRPSVHMNNGLFYTLLRTNSTFRREPGAKQLGHVAHFVAANIYLGLGGFAELTIDDLKIGDQPFEFTCEGGLGLTYQIDIFNDCKHTARPCVFHDPTGNDETERNDFYLYYDTFDIPAHQPKYELFLEIEGNDSDPEGICLFEADEVDDKSPCGATGFGGSPNNGG